MEFARTPLARSEDLVIEELGEELLVYDTETDRAHCLSSEAAVVWRRCDGRTSAEGLRAQLNMDAETVARALTELEACDLLEPTPELTLNVNGDPIAGTTRRELGIKAVKVGAVAAAGTMIVSVAAPTPAQAQTLAFCLNIDAQSEGCGACQQPGCCCCVRSALGGGQEKRCLDTSERCCDPNDPSGFGADTNCQSAGCSDAGPCPGTTAENCSQLDLT